MQRLPLPNVTPAERSALLDAKRARDAAQDRLVRACARRDELEQLVAQAAARTALLESFMTAPDFSDLSTMGREYVLREMAEQRERMPPATSSRSAGNDSSQDQTQLDASDAHAEALHEAQLRAVHDTIAVVEHDLQRCREHFGLSAPSGDGNDDDEKNASSPACDPADLVNRMGDLVALLEQIQIRQQHQRSHIGPSTEVPSSSVNVPRPVSHGSNATDRSIRVVVVEDDDEHDAAGLKQPPYDDDAILSDDSGGFDDDTLAV